MQRVGLTIFFLAGLLFSLTISSAQTPQAQKKYWVFFKDKGPQAPASGSLQKSTPAWTRAAQILSPRALQRRAKVSHATSVIDAEDLPLYQPYLDDVERVAGRTQRQSRWLKAASFFLTPEQRRRVENLPFVERVAPVALFYRHSESIEAHTPFLPRKAGSLDYGPSLAQNTMINAVKVHELGITGEGVIVGMLDTGFRWRIHEALQNARVIAEHDFIQNDDTTANQAGDATTQDSHGTLTMSVLGGHKPGQLIGPAYGSQFLLAKTEYVPTETRIEEDNWMAAIEWMESIGVDGVSSSLGYNDFDPPGPGPGDYSWDNGDFNGRTAVTSLAAVRAARLGVVVCTAMGNEGNGDGVRGTLIAPADADSILSIGAITFSRSLAGFSSTGPTNDARTKPEVVAPGAGVYGALPGQSSYGLVSGTSLSTPLAASTAALLLSARPELTAMQVRDSLLATADSIATGDPRAATRPNNFVGYGLVDVFRALLSFGPVFSNQPTVSLMGSENVITTFVASKFGLRPDSVQLKFTTPGSSSEQVVTMGLDSNMFFSTSGRYRGAVPQQPLGTLVRFHIEGHDSAGNMYSSPAPSAQTQWEFRYGSTTLGVPPLTFKLHQNYPNPFNAGTYIEFDTPSPARIELTVYNVLGQRIATVFNGMSVAGTNPPVFWDGRNDHGILVPSGVYLYCLRSLTFSDVKKMVLVR